MNDIYIIGITGTICSGKSRLCSAFTKKGIPTIDSDKVGHQVMNEQTTIETLIQHFGKEIYDETTHSIDRKKLGEIVFRNKKKLNELNDIMWDRIEEKIKHQIEQLKLEGHKIVVVEAAMLIKTNWMKWMNSIWVTTISPAIATERMKAGRNLNEDECKKRIKNQPSSKQYAQYADVLFDTRFKRKTLEKTFSQAIDDLLFELNINI